MSRAHQGCIYLIVNTVKPVKKILLQIKPTVLF